MNRTSSPFREDTVDVPIAVWEEDFGWRVEELFWEYFNRSEDPEGWNRRWSVERDVPWDQVAQDRLSDDAVLMLELFYATESFLPDFAENGLSYYRSVIGLSNSHINWSYEELKHGRTLQLVLERSGARTAAQMRAFRTQLARQRWMMPYLTSRQVLIYAAFQEKETNRTYERLHDALEAEGALGSACALRLIGRDEAFHHAFYKDVVKMLLEYDRVGTASDVQLVAESFRMPALHLIPNLGERLKAMVRHRVATRRSLREESIIPAIKAFGFHNVEHLRVVAANLSPTA